MFLPTILMLLEKVFDDADFVVVVKELSLENGIPESSLAKMLANARRLEQAERANDAAKIKKRPLAAKTDLTAIPPTNGAAPSSQSISPPVSGSSSSHAVADVPDTSAARVMNQNNLPKPTVAFGDRDPRGQPELRNELSYGGTERQSSADPNP